MARKSSTKEAAAVETQQAQDTPTGETTIVEEQAVDERVRLSGRDEREQLRALGLKRCPSHLRLLDRLPDEAKAQIDGYPVEVRRLSEFSKSTSYCKPCDHILMREQHERAKIGQGKTFDIERAQAQRTKLAEQYFEIGQKIKLLDRAIEDAKAKEQTAAE